MCIFFLLVFPMWMHVHILPVGQRALHTATSLAPHSATSLTPHTARAPLARLSRPSPSPHHLPLPHIVSIPQALSRAWSIWSEAHQRRQWRHRLQTHASLRNRRAELKVSFVEWRRSWEVAAKDAALEHCQLVQLMRLDEDRTRRESLQNEVEATGGQMLAAQRQCAVLQTRLEASEVAAEEGRCSCARLAGELNSLRAWRQEDEARRAAMEAELTASEEVMQEEMRHAADAIGRERSDRLEQLQRELSARVASEAVWRGVVLHADQQQAAARVAAVEACRRQRQLSALEESIQKAFNVLSAAASAEPVSAEASSAASVSSVAPPSATTPSAATPSATTPSAPTSSPIVQLVGGAAPTGRTSRGCEARPAAGKPEPSGDGVRPGSVDPPPRLGTDSRPRLTPRSVAPPRKARARPSPLSGSHIRKVERSILGSRPSPSCGGAFGRPPPPPAAVVEAVQEQEESAEELELVAGEEGGEGGEGEEGGEGGEGGEGLERAEGVEKAAVRMPAEGAPGQPLNLSLRASYGEAVSRELQQERDELRQRCRALQAQVLRQEVRM